MSLLEKLLCKHEWKELDNVDVYKDGDSPDFNDLPIYQKYLFVCTKCGKFKKITM